ncbi:MAG: hypothetical protein U9P37_00915, partial [Pseudomonadota bacterium]|nr:hypothetical protein [Pseudomonadota bacterium]
QELQVATSQLLHAIDPLASSNTPIKTSGIDHPGQPVTIDFTFIIPMELPFSGGYYFLNLPQAALPDEYTTCREKRRNPLLIENNFIAEVELDITLPKGYVFTTFPASSDGQLSNLSWKSASRVLDDTSLTWTRNINLSRGIIPADESYQQFRNAMIKLCKPESRMVIIKISN